MNSITIKEAEIQKRKRRLKFLFFINLGLILFYLVGMVFLLFQSSALRRKEPDDLGVSEQLKGDDRLEYETLLSMLSDADKVTDLDARHKILAEFMDQSGRFLKTHSNLEGLRMAQAAVAVELNGVHDRREAGRKLAALGMENSNDPGIQKVMVELNEKGWLTKDYPYQGPREGQNWTVPGVNLEMIWVSPGTFTMGSPPDEKGRRDDETQHTVTLTKGYWLGKYVVTISQWQKVMGSNPLFVNYDQHYLVDDGQAPDHDLVFEYTSRGLSWNDAMEFCRRLTEQADSTGLLPKGYVYTLPTEAQWEYACRAGTTGPYNVNGKFSDIGWSVGNSGFFSKIHPIGQKRPNAWGFYDMHGNVSEWCYDWYGPYPDGDTTNPTGPTSGSYHVRRGGDFVHFSKRCRSASRDRDGPFMLENAAVGFRLALAPVINQ